VLKAIDTRYKGYLFRSRLEARWAVFLDALGVAWRYEPQGFLLDNGEPYLPDFWVKLAGAWAGPFPAGDPPERGFWVEVKPVLLTEDERRKCELLAVGTGHCVYAVAGNIGLGEFHSYKWHPNNLRRDQEPEATRPDGYGRLDNLFLHYLCGQAAFSPSLETLSGAFAAARSARFEHGQYGAMVLM
jgi:hypothetical protein